MKESYVVTKQDLEHENTEKKQEEEEEENGNIVEDVSFKRL